MPADRPILVEGFKLLPRPVSPLLSDTHQAVWLLPTAEFRRKAFDSRGSTWEIPNKTSDPERALANLVARDELFTQALSREVRSWARACLRWTAVWTLRGRVRWSLTPWVWDPAATQA